MALAGAAAALAALFPLAALGTAVGGAVAPVAAGAGGAPGAGGLLGAMGGKVAVAVAAGATAVAATAGAVVYRQVADDEPAGRVQAPAATPTAQPVALTAVRDCPNADFGRPTPKPRPPVRLPRQVRLPPRTAVYEVTNSGGSGGHFIGPETRSCTATGGSGVGTAYATDGAYGTSVTLYLRNFPCYYFPDSQQARQLRRTDPTRCGDPEPMPGRQALPVGAAGWQAVLFRGPPNDRARSPYVSVSLYLLSPDRTPVLPGITCLMPQARAAVCTAALTYYFVDSTAKSGISQATLNADLRRIAAYVPTTRR